MTEYPCGGRDLVSLARSVRLPALNNKEAVLSAAQLIEPAAVEIHATYSGFSNEVCSVQIAPDKEAERQFLPDRSRLQDRLLLADRGYPGVVYFEAVREHGGAFIMRLSRAHDPWVRAAWVDGKRSRCPSQSGCHASSRRT
jgi:hypothetical protein